MFKHGHYEVSTECGLCTDSLPPTGNGAAGDRKPWPDSIIAGPHGVVSGSSGDPGDSTLLWVLGLLTLAHFMACSYLPSGGAGFCPFHGDFWKVTVPTHLFLSLMMEFICESETISFERSLLCSKIKIFLGQRDG